MLRALSLFNDFPPTYDMAILKDLTTTSFKKKSVVYLHGQHHGLWLLNTEEEMSKVKDVIPPIFNKITNQRPWIFIGYSGEDPIFEHIADLGRFDNGLYWVSYYDENPSEKVSTDLLEKPNTNAFLIKGFDADSFMIKLNNELNLPQPLIIGKPFSSLKTSLENIVDIDDEDHFKGVKKRLEIVKQQVDTAIEQFEEGNIEAKEKLKEKVDTNLLKKQIIDKIIKGEYDEHEIKSLEKESKKLNDKEVLDLLANLFSEWGIAFYELAKSENDEDLYHQSIEKYEKAVALNPKSSPIFSNWGLAIYELARLKKNEDLCLQSIEKHEKATALDPKNGSAFYNYGLAVYELARLKNDEDLYKQSIEKHKKATDLNPTDYHAFLSWGLSITELARLKKDENLYRLGFDKYEKSTILNPKYTLAFVNWGVAIANLALQKNDEILYQKSFDKYKKSIDLNPRFSSAFMNWGNTISNLAKFKKDEELYQQCFVKYKKAAALEPKNNSIYNNWGLAISDLAKLKNDKMLLLQGLEMLHKTVEMGGRSYNLSCVYARENEKDKALKYLENSLIKKEITVKFIEEDEDWKAYKDDVGFIALLKKYNTT
jgi:tetratricopeptide (TPR) repeat protein